MQNEDMNYKYFLGLDCSKKTLDYSIVNNAGRLLESGVIENKPHVIAELIERIIAQYECLIDDILICAENTGLYSNFLKVVATNNDGKLWCEDALELKLRSGKQKGKTDPGDALAIAQYAHRYADKAKLFVMPSQTALRIKEVSRQRSCLVQDITAWKVRLEEQKSFGLSKDMTNVRQLLKKHIKDTEKIIKQLDSILTELVKSDKVLKRKYDIACSSPGFGPKNTISLIAETEAFSKTPNGKACASYAGLVPHKYESGTSIKRKARTSKACNKRLKTAIHLGAMSLIKHDNIYRRLYDRMIGKGKHHLQAVNAVRNKMVTVLYACLRDDVMYDKNIHECLDLP